MKWKITSSVCGFDLSAYNGTGFPSALGMSVGTPETNYICVRTPEWRSSPTPHVLCPCPKVWQTLFICWMCLRGSCIKQRCVYRLATAMGYWRCDPAKDPQAHSWFPVTPLYTQPVEKNEENSSVGEQIAEGGKLAPFYLLKQVVDWGEFKGTVLNWSPSFGFCGCCRCVVWIWARSPTGRGGCHSAEYFCATSSCWPGSAADVDCQCLV